MTSYPARGLSPKGTVPLSPNRQRGYLLVTVIITLFLVASIAVLLAHDSANSANTSNKELETARVDYVAAAGLQHALWRAQNNACMGDVTIPDTSLGADTYSATLTGTAAGTLFALTADQDAWIRSDDVTKNNGTGVTNHIKQDAGKVEQVLTRFDLTSIPATSQINSAVAWFHLIAGKDHPEGPINVHEVTADWTETSVTWQSFSGSYVKDRMARLPAQDAGDVWVAINITGQVQAWVNGRPNYGLLFDTQAEGIHTEYTAREDGANPPRLEVVVGSGPASPVTIKATGTLDNGVNRNLKDKLTAAYQPTTVTSVDPVGDVYLKQDGPTSNFGASSDLWVEDPGGSNKADNSLLRFNMTSIPRGARVTSATLELYAYWDISSGPGSSIGVHRVTRDWVEGTGTGTGASWNEREPGTSWSSGGGDYDSTAAAISDSPPSTTGWHEWDVTHLVNDWSTGTYPNQGLILVAENSTTLVGFRSSDYSNSSHRPKLTITYSCECGDACMVPNGSGNVLMVIGTFSPSAFDQALRDRLESWGYSVNFIQDDDSQGNFNAAIGSNDVVVVSETVESNNIGTKLTGTASGVVNMERFLNDELGIATGFALPVGKQVDIVDVSHYITSIFSSGPIDIYDAAMEGGTASGTEALQQLADWGGAGALIAVDAGTPLAGGGTAAGRRVLVPFGRAAEINLDYVSGNGWLMLQRALAWGMNADKTPVGNLLLVVSKADDPEDEDIDRRDLFESWGYVVTLIDDEANQAEFDTEAAANDVIYVADSIEDDELADKLTSSTVGIVNEEGMMLAEFGLGSDVPPITTSWNAYTATDAAHYVSEPLAGAGVTMFTQNRTMSLPKGTIAPEMQAVGLIGGQQILVTLDAGAVRWDGNPSPGRRVHLPFGAANVSELTDDGMTLMRRSLEWAAGAGESVSTGPIAHWKLDDGTGLTAIDSEGGHDGTLFNNPTWVTGVLDGALDFDGSDDYIRVPHDDKLILTDAFTLSAWVTANNTFGYHTIINKGTSGNNQDYWFGIWGNWLTLGFYTGGGFQYVEAQMTSWNPAQPTHFTATFDNAADTVNLYVNGTLLHTATQTFEPLPGTEDLVIGQSQLSERWNGMLDDIRIYDRVLSPEEIAELATVSTDGPIAHWKLDETSGTTAVDSVGGHDGTLTNGPAWASGQLGGAVSLDGSNDYINVPHDNTLSLTTFSMSAWIYPTALSGWQGIVVKGFTPNVANYYFNVHNDEIGFGFYNNGWEDFATTTANLSTNRWYHAAVTFEDSTGEGKIYLDGVLHSTGTTAKSPLPNSDSLVLGRTETTGEYWPGLLDDIRIYDKLLSAPEIADLASAGGGGGGGGGDPDACDGRFRDEFESRSYSNDDGSLSWASNWLETGETTSPTGGDIRIDDDDEGERDEYQLMLRDDGQTVAREVDLGAAGSATLSFLYRRENLQNSGDYVAVDVSYNGGGSWSELDRFIGSATDSSYLSASYPLASAQLSDSTRIRFRTPTGGMRDNNQVWFDDIEISCAP